MSSDHFEFRSVWKLPCDPGRVFTALSDFESYPRWWSSVRSVSVANGRFRTVCRSVLPYDLHVDIAQGRFDPEAGLIEGLLAGDLVGRAMWTVAHDGDGTVSTYDQTVRVAATSLRRIAPFARGALAFNHRMMMNTGRAGLHRHLCNSR